MNRNEGYSTMSAPSSLPSALELAITSDQALRIARLDGEKAYGDLTPYRIEIQLEEDGWHVDYELKNPDLNGSGPHYVIDAVNGTIASKVYEQ
jgi:hypothetical protein